MLTYEREKKIRDIVEKFTCDFDGDQNVQNTVRENVLISAGELFGSTLPYDGKRKFPAETENTLDDNYYWSDTPAHMIGCGASVDLATWQKLSGQDKGSRVIDPWAQRDQMPDWFKERFHFAKDQFRQAEQTWETYISGKVRRSVAQIVLYSRLLRAKTIEEAKFADPNLCGYYFDLEGKPALTIWSKGPTVKDFLAPQGAQLVQENKWLQRRDVENAGGRFRLFLNEDPLTLTGMDGKIAEDTSVVVDLPLHSPSGKPVAGTIALTNPDKAQRDYDLQVAVGKDWTISPATIKKTLGPGEQARIELKLQPPADLTQGVLQSSVSGSVGGRDVTVTRTFGVGEARTIKARDRYLSINGDMAEWQGLAPTGVADKAEQVVQGRDQWKGPQDLSAKVYLLWQDYRELYFAADVTEDALVTSHRGDDPTKFRQRRAAGGRPPAVEAVHERVYPRHVPRAAGARRRQVADDRQVPGPAAGRDRQVRLKEDRPRLRGPDADTFPHRPDRIARLVGRPGNPRGRARAPQRRRIRQGMQVHDRPVAHRRRRGHQRRLADQHEARKIAHAKSTKLGLWGVLPPA